MAVGLAGSCLLPSTARADEFNKETIVTFNAPVEVPGHVLPAGKYVFKLADTNSNRDIVEIFNANQTHLIAFIMGVPDYRLQPTDRTKISFEERSAGSPEAIHSWFYPGDDSGVEFIHSKARVVQTDASASAEAMAPQVVD